ncbi:MAG: gliding motility-associated C-terminal domain-containing protein [Saprospiraceae bacterium]|nr:gliding motility-associated C-terminal domain-containing protein [Saprospiraceae bacterium]
MRPFVFKMTNIYGMYLNSGLLSIVLLLWGALPNSRLSDSSEQSGIETSLEYSVESLVQDIFVGGACKNIFNITYTGHEKGIGFFEGGNDVMGIDRGIILATGPINSAEGPNSSGKESGNFRTNNGDQDLNLLTDAPIRDAVALEFDFVPLDSVVTFRYVFASEEYCEFVGKIFNDVFGFFVSGPGIEGAFTNQSDNVALIPGTSDYVSINTVNHVANSSYYINNTNRTDSENCGIAYDPDNPVRQQIEYDGFTQVLTATLRLIPCETYHLRLVVADVSDPHYDSAVFLEAESFNIGGEVNLQALGSSGSDTIPEGCDYGFFRLNRLDPTDLTDSISIGLKVSLSSTAEVYEDFLPLPEIATIPAGMPYVDIPVDVLIDSNNEGMETLFLELDFPCACISDTARLYIEDPPAMESGLYDRMICQGEWFELALRPWGGVPGYTYKWEDGSTDSVLNIQPDMDKAWSYTITDNCGRTLEDSVWIRLREAPELRMPNELKSVCLGETGIFNLAFSGTPPFGFTYQVDTLPPVSVIENWETNYPLEVGHEGKIQILDFYDDVCSGQVLGEAELRFFRLQTLVKTTSPSCYGFNDGEISVSVAGGTAPYTFRWNNGVPDTPAPQGLVADLYRCTVTDANNCEIEVSQTLEEPPILQPVSISCREIGGNRPVFSASGGTPPYYYPIDNSPFLDNSIFYQLVAGKAYNLLIEDAAGCTLQQDFVMPAFTEEMAALPDRIKLELGEKYTLVPELYIPENLIETVEWFPADQLSCSDCLQPEIHALNPVKLNLRIDDVFGCTDVISVDIDLDRQAAIYVPTAFSPNGDQMNDRLVIFGDVRQVEEILLMEVYNRWGTQVFHLENFLPNQDMLGWDGTFNGKTLNSGVFIYRLSYRLTNGEEKTITGDFSLMH